MDYAYQKIINLDFENVNGKIRESLMNVGFGIITEIDVQKTFKEKLDIHYERFQILGACNPSLAHEALSIDCLLYTSPSPRDMRRSRMPSSA